MAVLMVDLWHAPASTTAAVARAMEQLALKLGYAAVARQCSSSVRDRVNSPAPDLSVLTTPTGLPVKPGSVSVLKRLHVAAADVSQAHAALLGQPEEWLHQYDVVSIQPGSERVLLQALSSLPVDVITLDCSQRLPFKLRPATLRKAAKAGVHVEIVYAPAMRDESTYRSLLSNTQTLSRLLHGKNIIISSGASTAKELRSPEDVIKLAALFGLSDRHAKAAISTRCIHVLEHAATRKLHKGALRIVPRAPLIAQVAVPVKQSKPPKTDADLMDVE